MPDTDQEITLSDAQLARIVEAAAEKASEKAVEKVFEKIYTEVGRSVVAKFMWVCGLGFIGLASFLAGAGKIKL